MLIGFTRTEAVTLPGLNNGTGTMTARMYIGEHGKIIPCAVHPVGSIGLHKHETSDDINCVISGTGKAAADDVESR